jgi:hypothetical protein
MKTIVDKHFCSFSKLGIDLKLTLMARAPALLPLICSKKREWLTKNNKKVVNCKKTII